jgi:hypothetical protein
MNFKNLSLKKNGSLKKIKYLVFAAEETSFILENLEYCVKAIPYTILKNNL